VDCGHQQQAYMNLPKLKTLKDITGLHSYREAFRLLEEDLFPVMPPIYIVADYTNEKTFTDLLIEDYGDERVEPINFTIPSKTALKEDGLSIIKMGYEFPDPRHIPDTMASTRVRNLVNQLLHEQVITTKSGKITFDHEEGKHNDLAISWELSIHGCLKFILKHITPGGAAISVRTTDDMFKSKRKTTIKTEDLIADLKQDPNVTVTGVYTHGT
jgi:hypothetical protein